MGSVRVRETTSTIGLRVNIRIRVYWMREKLGSKGLSASGQSEDWRNFHSFNLEKPEFAEV